MNPTQTLPYLPLAKSFLPTRTLIRDVVLVLAGCLFVALTAQFAVGAPVPITGQTFGVLLVGAVLGSRLGFLALVTYVLAGSLGAPFFAGGASGIGKGLTLGYLVAFPIAAWLVGYLVERFGADRSFFKTLGMMLVANLLIYAIGVPWLGYVGFKLGIFKDWNTVIMAGMTKFLLGDFIKAVLAASLLPLAWRFVGRK
ncbi:BioY protein [Allomeiothermus silvanus DSM 9946]|uniref:Biotin transporter n=1 Tax=Allomeiothermus silvanus (strain ATCC 700542 / DSM 9946 / NBRC 106475 / NCIMB 13440 / VI-R2) TaxID=526227 RepID=D7BDB0_ALLS1|nr:biotin transporter BioY [Allomeiothermus silvanus]ADH63028.1 BioY protein [Allomeiothermus silvanus DSM 9946]